MTIRHLLLSVSGLFCLVFYPAIAQTGQQAISPAGSWKTYLANSQTTAELSLTLEVQSSDLLSGSYTLQDGTVGALSGQVNNNVLYLAFVGKANNCPTTFSLKISLAGSAGAGTYTATDCNDAQETGTVSMVQTSQSDELSKCWTQHKQEAYWTWLCDAEGKFFSDYVSIFNLRTNQFGQSGVMSVWSGSKSDWQEESEKIISRHQKDTASCEIYYHVAYVGQNGSIQWNWFTKNMLNWYKKNARKKFPKLCATAQVAAADYLIAYANSSYTVPYSFNIPIPKTTYYSGTTSGYSGTGYVSGTYSGYSTTTQNQTYSGSRNQWDVYAVVYPNKPNSTIVYNTKHTGRWRWSKPDKDSFLDALKFLKDQ